jgi:cobalamin biosynthesis protein CobD/CbiB
MSLLSLIAALLIEQLHPLAQRRQISIGIARYANFLEHQVNAGERKHGVLAWTLAVVPAVVATAVIYWLLYRVHPLLGLAWNVAVLYITMGFRQFSHYFTDIHHALRQGDIESARELLSAWRGQSSNGLDAGDIARLAIEEGIVAAHYHVFAVVVWFVLLPGPSGALLYRLSLHLSKRWGGLTEAGPFAEFPRRAFAVLDWLPSRFTAAAFAIVGDFEDAVYCWRSQAALWPDHNLGVVLASGAGALGVKLGMPIRQGNELVDRPELGVGDMADAAFMESAVGLGWRALVMWLFLLLLLGFASVVG